MAITYLLSKAYQILSRNWRYEKAEVDIIAFDKNFLVFIEVKWRKSDEFGAPHEAVNIQKENLLKFAAEQYLEKMNLENEVRFDIISIVGEEPNVKIEHIEWAF